jgi:hypothetical protein
MSSSSADLSGIEKKYDLHRQGGEDFRYLFSDLHGPRAAATPEQTAEARAASAVERHAGHAIHHAGPRGH